MKALNNLLILTICVLLSSCNEKEVQSSWARSSVTVDGNMEEWKDDPLLVFTDEHLALGVKNDSKYIYLAGRIADAALQRVAQRLGVTFWVDPDGGDNQDLEIHFPASSLGLLNQARGGFWQSMTEEERAKARERMDETREGLLVIDKRNNDSRVFAANSSEGFAAGQRNSEGLFSFELRLPIQVQQYFRGFNELGKEGKVGIGIKVGASRPEGMRGFRPEGGGGPQGPFGGRGRPGGGGGRGGGRGGPRGGGQSGPIESEVAFVVNLATNR